MALIKCKECGKDVSDKAKACPNCGNTILTKKDEENAEGMKILKIIIAVILICSGLVIYSSSIKDIEGKNNKQYSTKTEFEVISSNMSQNDEQVIIKGKIRQNTNKTYNKIKVVYVIYDINNMKIQNTIETNSKYLNNGIWEFESIGKTDTKKAVSYKLISISGI